jgi:hypothetical protein
VNDQTQPQDYFLEIEAHFALRRGTPFILNAKDWALMKKWREDEIPLPVIIEAIDSVFEKNSHSGRNKTISSLSYCRHAVRDLWEERRNLHVGDHDSVPEEDATEPLSQLAGGVMSSSLPPELASALADEVKALATLRSVPRIEERLIEIEQELFARLLAALSDDERNALQAAMVRSLGDPARLDEKTRKRTEDANQRRLLRERYGLPRLTLFH